MRRSGRVEGPVRFHCDYIDGRWCSKDKDVDFSAVTAPDCLIGHGSFSSVYRVAFRGGPAAGKTFDALLEPEACGLDLGSGGASSSSKPGKDRVRLEQLMQDVEPELKVLESILRHPSLCCCLGVGYAELAGVMVPMWFVMELAEESFHTFLHGGDRAALAPAEALRRWIQILIGLDVLHALGVVHMNIKPRNILVRGRSGRVMIADHCFARLRNCLSNLTGRTEETCTYIAPEGMMSVKADIYAAAILLAEMLTGEEPPQSRELRLTWVHRACTLLPDPASGTLARAASDDPRVRPAVAEALFSIFDCEGLSSSAASSNQETSPFAQLDSGMTELEKRAGLAIDALQAEATQAFAEAREDRAALAEVAAALEKQHLLIENAEHDLVADTVEATAAVTAVLEEVAQAAAVQIAMAEEGERRLEAGEAEVAAQLGICCPKEEKDKSSCEKCKNEQREQAIGGVNEDLQRAESVAHQSLFEQEALVAELRRAVLQKDQQMLNEANLIDQLRRSANDRESEMAQLRTQLREFEAQLPMRAPVTEALDRGKILKRSNSEEVSPRNHGFIVLSTSAEEAKLRNSWPPQKDERHVSIETEASMASVVCRGKFTSKAVADASEEVPRQESELTKVLNRRRNQVQSQERVFFSAEPTTKPKTDASWSIRRTLMAKKNGDDDDAEVEV